MKQMRRILLLAAACGLLALSACQEPGGSPAGFVIYTNQRTLYMTVSEADIRKIELVK